MGSATDTRFSIIPEGEFKEEAWEWSAIEAMAREGRLSPNTLIFMPNENAWKKLGETTLAGCFGKAALSGAPSPGATRDAGQTGKPAKAVEPDGPSEAAAETGEDESLLEQIRSNPGDVALLLRAADAAVAARRPDAAFRYYQRALDVSPYHPRIAQEAKRKLPPSKWKSLKFLEKPTQVWEDPVAVLAFPLSRGPVYLGAPALALAALFWTPWTAALALVAASLWAIETARVTSLGERRPPLWHGLVADPRSRIVKPAVVTVVVAAELSALFVAVAGVLIVTRLSASRDLFAVIAKSPVMTVLLCTLLISYFPAVIALCAGPQWGIVDVLNPKRIVRAIRVMEGEYLVSVAAVAVLLCVMWGLGAVVGSLPVLGLVFYGAATVYVVLFGGFVLGRLNARFRERLDAREGDGGDEDTASDAE